MRKSFELYATGNFALYEIRARMNAVGLLSCAGKRMSVSNYQSMFKNPFYYGVMSFNGELFEGKHDPVISKRLFDEVHAVMDRKSKAKTPVLKPYLYRGLFQCGECGCVITTETQKGHNYLRCTKRVGATSDGLGHQLACHRRSLMIRRSKPSASSRTRKPWPAGGNPLRIARKSGARGRRDGHGGAVAVAGPAYRSQLNVNQASAYVIGHRFTKS